VLVTPLQTQYLPEWAGSGCRDSRGGSKDISHIEMAMPIFPELAQHITLLLRRRFLNHRLLGRRFKKQCFFPFHASLQEARVTHLTSRRGTYKNAIKTICPITMGNP
jgi:hypothetical protein